MLHRLADGLRRFFKFSSGKNRLPVQPLAEPVSGLNGKEKKSDQQSEPKGSQKSNEFEADKYSVDEIRSWFTSSPTVVTGPSTSGKNHQWLYLKNHEAIRKKVFSKDQSQEMAD